MLEEKVLIQNAADALISIFGKKYLQDTYVGSCTAHGMITDDLFMFFVGIKGSSDLPNRKANDKGWVVYGKVLLDANSGKVVKTEYCLE